MIVLFWMKNQTKTHPKKDSKELEYFPKTISLSSVWLRDSHKIHLGNTHWQVWMSLNATPSPPTHTQPSMLSAGDLEMGAEACALVWRSALAKAHTFGLPGALWTPGCAQKYQRASWRSTTLLWTHLTEWFLMVENSYQSNRRLVFHWKTIYTGNLSVPSGIK